MSIKTILAKLHLWLGLALSPLVFFVCITGTILVFGDEIIDWAAGKNRYVQEVKAERVPVENLLARLQEAFPNRRMPSYMVAYRNPQRTVRFNSYDPDKGLRMVYMDPYTGELLKDDATIHFFYVLAHLHASLLWHGTGEWIIDIAVLVFVFLLLTGLVLWWPKTWEKKYRKAALSVKVKAGWKRINHDLHSVLGFYSLALVLVLSLTGLIIAFKPLAHSTTNLLGGNAQAPWESAFPAYDSTASDTYPLNHLLTYTFNKFPERDELQVYTYFLRDKGFIPIKATNQVNLKSVSGLDYVVFNRYTGAELALDAQVLLTERIENMYWVLHMGTWGLWGKILTFITGLIASSLPLTGFYIWWNKYKVKRKTRRELKGVKG